MSNWKKGVSDWNIMRVGQALMRINKKNRISGSFFRYQKYNSWDRGFAQFIHDDRTLMQRTKWLIVDVATKEGSVYDKKNIKFFKQWNRDEKKYDYTD